MLTKGYRVANLKKGFTMFCIDKGSDLDKLEKMIKRYSKEKQNQLMGHIVNGLFVETKAEPHNVNSVVFSRIEDGTQLVFASASHINMDAVYDEMMVLEGEIATPFAIDVHNIINRAFCETRPDENDNEEEPESAYYYKCSLSDLSKIPFKMDAILLMDAKGQVYVHTSNLVEDFLGAPVVFEYPPIMKVIGHASEYQ